MSPRDPPSRAGDMSRKHPGSRHFAKLDRKRWALQRLKIMARDLWRCCKCGRAGRLECDHVVPLHKNGAPYDPDNLQALCTDCHRQKTLEDNGHGPDPEREAWQELVAEISKA